MKSHLLFRHKDFNAESPKPSNHEDLIKDLALEILFAAMSKGDAFIYEISKQVVLTGVDDIDGIKYRQDVLNDCLKNKEIVEYIYDLCLLAKQSKHRRWLGIFAQSPRGILSSAVQMMLMFSQLLRQLKAITDKSAGSFDSEGFRKMFTMLSLELSDEYLDEIDRHLELLQFKNGMLASVHLGKGNEGELYTLLLPEKRSLNWINGLFNKFTGKSPEYSFVVPPRDDGGHRALAGLIDRSVNEVANALAQSANHIDAFFQNLQAELAFYRGCMNLNEVIQENNLPITFPEVQRVESRDYEIDDLFDICLALQTSEKVVGNRIHASEKDMVIITGANQGGKSTFLRSFGLAQLMMEAGMFVGAASFSAPLSRGVYTHFKREEDSAMKRGKLDEELERMSQIVDSVSPNTLILFNESFSATNEGEGSEIAKKITRALLSCGIRLFFVTHMYEFAHAIFDELPSNVLFLRAERQPDGSRTFKLKQGEPLATSFGKDIFQQVFNLTDLNLS